MKICFVAEWYLPGVQAGGTVRALANLVSALEGSAEIFILTRDRDFGSDAQYANVKSGAWNQVGGSKVFYSPSLSWKVIRQVVTDLKPDIIYINSFFSPVTVTLLVLRSLKLIPSCSVILAPHGELHPGALSVKWLKKTLFIQVVLRSGLYRGVSWHATTADEKQMILRTVPQRMTVARVREKDILVAENIAVVPVSGFETIAKASGQSRFVYIGRISRKKNLHSAIELLRELKGTVTFDVFGVLEDPSYWRECLDAISGLPANIKVTYRGSVSPDAVHDVFGGGHFFLFPSLGENYGYTIVESLNAGCPVITSTEVPWLEMENFNAGWCILLDDIGRWREVLQRCVDMSQEEYDSMVAGARTFCKARINTERARLHSLAMFEEVARRA